MNKRILFSLTILSSIFIFSACSSSVNKNNSANLSVDKDSASSPSSPDMRRPDFGQPDREADLRGIVTSLVGNEATILEVEIGMGRGRASSTEVKSGDGVENEEKPSVSLTGGALPGLPERRMGMGPGRDGDNLSNRSDMIAKLKEISTGESKIVIPVGIRMLKVSSSDGKREMVEANLEDISSDKTLTIWLNKDISDRKVAEFVLIN